MKTLTGILGMGLSGSAALSFLEAKDEKIIIYDDKLEPNEKQKKYWKNYINWDWKKISRIIISPGIKLYGQNKHPAIKLAEENNVKLINEIELFFEQKPKSKIIGITGTNGKSTLVSLIAHILTENNIQNTLCGNFGYPVCLVDSTKDEKVIIIELSSYQLLSIPNLKVDFGVITNISKDHLDFHGNFNSYLNAKLRLIDSLKENGTLIINHFDQFLRDKIFKRIEKPFNNFKIINTKGIRYKSSHIVGNHNFVLLEIAYLIAKKLGIKETSIKSSISNFKPLSHRMEIIYISKFFNIINDSKATNGNSASAALRSFKNIHWIAGGLAKEDGLGEAVNYLKEVEAIYLFGSSKKTFKKQLIKSSFSKKIFEYNDLKELIDSLFVKIKKSKSYPLTILFSPAAASFDQYKNFEERGESFKTIISQITPKIKNDTFSF